AVNMRFEYATDTPGFVSTERNGVTGNVMVSLAVTSDTQRSVSYANGKVAVIDTLGQGNVGSKVDGLGRQTSFTYDQNGFGFVIAQTDALGRVTQMTNTKYGNLLSRTYPDRSVETWTRDTLDLILTYTDGLGRRTTYTRDAQHRITRTDYP